MAASTPLDRLHAHITSITAMGVTGTWLAAMFLGFSWWLPFMLFGYMVIVPLVAILSGDDEDVDGVLSPDAQSVDSSEANPIQSLWRRYADNELTNEQFEHKLEKILKTEALEAGIDWGDDDLLTVSVSEVETNSKPPQSP